MAGVLERNKVFALGIILEVWANHLWFTLGRLGQIESLVQEKKFGNLVELGLILVRFLVKVLI
jgi:hypothetical protein